MMAITEQGFDTVMEFSEHEMPNFFLFSDGSASIAHLVDLL